jgi:hypothetical protein
MPGSVDESLRPVGLQSVQQSMESITVITPEPSSIHSHHEPGVFGSSALEGAQIETAAQIEHDDRNPRSKIKIITVMLALYVSSTSDFYSFIPS